MPRLQSVLNLNAAARLIFSLKRSDHISDAFVSLHWLRVQKRIHYKIAVGLLSYKVLHDTAPRYLGPLTRVADIPTWSTSTLLYQHLSPGRRPTSFQTFHHRRPSFSSCRRTDLKLAARNSGFGINTVVVAPIENFPTSTILHSLAL